MIGKLFSLTIRAYQKTVSPLLGPRCRFYPSCSEYARYCFENYSLVKAISKISFRIVRCNPLNPGGVDLP